MRLLPLPLVLLVGCVDAEQLADRDGDGFPSVEANCANCTDCDDADPDIHPDAEELCDDVDNDCDGDVDSDATDRSVYYVDGDGDGVGATEVRACTLPDDASVTPGDCDDADPTSKPGGTEVCDGADNDCDGQTDEEAIDPEDWYADSDGDTYGDADDTESSCDAPSGYVADDTDCNDGDAGVNPGATEVAYNDVDEDCSGADLVDVDGDGYDAVEAGGDDCDDADVGVNPGADETWEDGFTDNDCDGGLETDNLIYGAGSGWDGLSEGAHAGQIVAAFDVDGTPTVFVSATSESTVQSTGGAVYLVTGSTSGMLSSMPTISPSSDDMFLGVGLDAGTDIDGDGATDLFVSATGAGAFAGRTYVLLGPVDSDRSTAAADIAIDGPSDGISGAKVRVAEDVTGDGFPDLLISAPFAENGGVATAGEVAVFDAATALSSGSLAWANADVVWSGNDTESKLGNQLFVVDDQDDDGIDDIAMSSDGLRPLLVAGGSPSGQAWELRITYVPTFSDPAPAFWPIADVDGDGKMDFLVGDDDEARIYANVADNPSPSVGAWHARVVSDGTNRIRRAHNINDRTGDGLAELVLASIDQGGSHGWVGFVPSEELAEGASLSAADLALQAEASTSTGVPGYSSALSEDYLGDGTDMLIMGDWLDNNGASESGRVLFVELPSL